MIIELLRLIILSTSIFLKISHVFCSYLKFSMRCKASNHLMYFVWLIQEKQFFTYFVILQKLLSEASFSLSHNIRHFFLLFSKSLSVAFNQKKIFILKLKSNTFDFPSLLLSIDFFSFVTFFSSSFSCCTEAARHGTHVMHLDRIAC